MPNYKYINNELTILSDAEETALETDQTRLTADKTANGYKIVRQQLYPSLGDFADAMYWNSKGDSTKLEAYYAACEKVKTDNPKPS